MHGQFGEIYGDKNAGLLGKIHADDRMTTALGLDYRISHHSFETGRCSWIEHVSHSLTPHALSIAIRKFQISPFADSQECQLLEHSRTVEKNDDRCCGSLSTLTPTPCRYS